MKQNSSANRTLSNLIWRFAERCGAQGVTILVSIVMARIMEPEVIGLVSLVTVFITIMQVFVDSGLGTALIQKQEADDVDFSSVFYFNFVVCIILYILMFFLAPIIAKFYNNISLVAIIRVISLLIIISGVKGIQQAYVSRHMIFKKFFYATLGGTIFSAFLGIGLALSGAGVWAIVVQQLSNAFIDTIILWITVKWRPKKLFSWERLKEMLSFGWKMLASTLLDTIYNNLRSLLIGKMYSSADLAYYNQGRQFPSVIVNNINISINSVLLPVMSGVQDNKECVKEMTRKSIKISTYIMAPLMIGMFFCAEPIVSVVLTKKWLSCVPFLRIFCITYMFYPIHTSNLNAITAQGRSDIFLKLEIIKKVVGLVVLLISIRFGVLAMAYSLLLTSFLGQLINSFPNKKLLDYGYVEQLKDIIPSIFLAVAMGVSISMVRLFDFRDLETLVIQIFMGVVFYVGGSIIFRFEEFDYLKNTIYSMLYKFIKR